MDFSDDSQDLNDFVALEQQIRSEPPEQLEQFAAMFKSYNKSTHVQDDFQNDAFGDLRLDFEYEYPERPAAYPVQPVQPIKQTEKAEPRQLIKLNKAGYEVVKKRLEYKSQLPVAPIEYISDEHDFDYYLRYLEVEINKYKQMYQQLELDKRNLHLDYDDQFRYLEQERYAFAKFKKEKEAEFKRQKQIIDEARSSRYVKDKQQEVVERYNQELLDYCTYLKAELKRYQQAARTQLEAAKLANEKLTTENNDLLSKVTSYDKQMIYNKQSEINYKKQIASKDKQIEDLNASVRELNMNLKELQIRLEERDKMLYQVKPAESQNEALEKYDQLLGNVEKAKKPVKEQVSQAAAELVTKKSIKELRGYDSQAYRLPASASIKPKKSGPQIDRNYFYNIPFFEAQDLFDYFNKDVDEFIDKSEIRQSKKLEDREEFVYLSGARRFIFRNGTEKIVLPTGVTDIYFDNGDIKRVDQSNQTSVYFYADVGTLFTQLQSSAGAVKVYRFSNDQMEKHYEDGRKVVYYPDGTMKYVYADGTEKAVFPDGEVVYN